MDVDQAQTDGPVHGLPASLLVVQNKKVAVLSLMQQHAGLNRQRKQYVKLVKSALRLAPERVRSEISARDLTVLTNYLDPTRRFNSFWELMRRLAAGGALKGSMAYAMSVEIQLLDAFNPTWMSAKFDEGALARACAEWGRISVRLYARRDIQQSVGLTAFMLWPSIVENLLEWQDLEPARRIAVCNAVFALSSIGWSNWFVRQAIKHCPGAAAELGQLLSGDEARQDEAEAGDTPSVGSGAGGISTPAASGQLWDALLARLDHISEEIHRQPTQDAVSDLSLLAADFKAIAKDLPARAVSEIAQFEARHRVLIDHLIALAQNAPFDWLDAELIEQIDTRWKSQHAESLALDRLAALSEDAARAVGRTDHAAGNYADSVDAHAHAHREMIIADEALRAAVGFACKSAARRQLTDARRLQIEAEETQHLQQSALLDAATPFGGPFETEQSSPLDMVEAVSNPHSLGVESVVDAPSGLTKADDADESLESPPCEPGQMLSESDRTSGSNGEPQRDSLASDAASIGWVQTSAVHMLGVQDFPDDDDRGEVYSVQAGERCRPIWRSLSNGFPALAFHAAQWVDQVHPGTRVPPPDLLAAVALSDALVLPGGAVQNALGARFAALESEDYENPTPRHWHAALNLLLVAATLRPMVLAPSTGAQAVAAYLHQDGHYPALYEMVQKIKALSVKLMGFRIEPIALRKARGEAAIRLELDAFSHEADDWITQQAPHYTIKFAPATSVWKHMVRAGGVIDQLLTPVLENRPDDAAQVKESLSQLSDLDHVTRLIHTIDRKTLKRLRGEDIHSGALEHLIRLIDEALRIPRQWLGLVELLGGRGDRLRVLLEDVHGVIKGSLPKVEAELLTAPQSDRWGHVAAGQRQALSAVHGLVALFENDEALREVEQPPAEILGRHLLLLPALPVSDAWAAEWETPAALALLEDADTTVLRPLDALRRRLERGDVLGAEMMVASGLVEPDPGLLRQARDRWKAETKREIAECRRLVEVGSTYGYLQDADRGQIESKLSRWEAHLEEMRRFDLTLASIKAHRDQIEAVRDAKKAEVRVGLAAIPPTEANKGASEDIERALDDGDVTRAHELLHWLEQGKPTPAELNEPDGEGFGDFFPLTFTKIEAWLQSNTRRDQIEHAIHSGALASYTDSYVHDSAARATTAKMYGAWADMKGQQNAAEPRLTTLLTGLGFTVRELQRAERVSGREIWNFDASVIDDRNLCALPTYGSFANGRYRVICVWGRPTEDEFLNWVGDASNSRPAIILYFGRQSERKWRELSRLAKTRRRSFVFLDETLLFYLFTVSGSRLAAWFDSALPFAYTSPYDATAGLVPPEMFYGRSAELDAVFGLNGRCFIYGGRQLGKTALLKRAEQSFHRPKNGNFSKWIDLRAEGIGVSLAASEIWLTLFEKLREVGVLDSRSLAPTPGKKQGVEAVIRGIRDFLSQNGDRRILLLMDEADRFFEQDGRNDFEETRKIKQLMDDTQRRFKVVFAGLHNVLRMTERPNHPLAHFGEPIEIGPLREGIEVREAADLIRKPMAAAGFAFESKGLVIRILAQTNYYPSLIQLYCSHLLRHALGQVASKARADGPRYVVDDRDIEQVYSSEALRDEIRAKFRLTLQLDPKYEVLAYAMALDLLRGNYVQSEGQSWHFIRQAGALHWWADGFRDTSELDFRVLLDEMVGLGVLRRLSSGNYVLRNPNVLLLLGTQEEIETVLNKEREPVVEFEGATFRPPLRQNPSSPRKNVFSYQQLSRLLQRSNEVAIVAGTLAAGIDQIYSSLADYLGSGAAPVLFANCNDAAAFGRELQMALSDRPKDQVSVFVIPHTAPWTDRWIDEAKAKLRGLRSVNKFASVVFVADPATLWQQLNDHEEGDDADLPWISLLQWSDGFLRHWLEEQQLQLDGDDRKRLSGATGLWPGLIIDLAGQCREVRKLRENIIEAEAWSSEGSSSMQSWIATFGLDIGVPTQIIDVLAQFKEPVLATDLVIVTEAEARTVELALRWGELLGITRREGAGYWTVDPFVSKVLGSGSL